MKKLFTAFALLLALALTACSSPTDTNTPSDTPTSETTTKASTTTPAPEPYIPNARYYKLPDGSIYTAPDDGDLFVLGFAMVRENNGDIDVEWQKLTAGNTWNDLWVKYAQSGWLWAYKSYSDAVSASTTGYMAHHQLINFIGEVTFTGKADIIYAADGETPAYTVFFPDEESGGEMPLFPSFYTDNNGYQQVFFNLYHGDYEDRFDEITALLLEGKEVTVTVTTDDFMWEYSDYGLVIDGNTRGYFNTILNFEISVI